MTNAQQTDDAVRTELRSFVEENYLYMRPDLELGDGDSFLELGVMDSLGFVELVEEVQARYGLSVGDEEITEENFGSIAALTDYVSRKRGG